MKYRFAALLLCLLSLPAWAANSSKVASVYSVMRSGQAIGEIHETLTITPGHYRLESSTIAVGVLAVFVKETITQTSSGLCDETGFHPQQYTYQRSNKPQKIWMRASTGKRKPPPLTSTAKPKPKPCRSTCKTA